MESTVINERGERVIPGSRRPDGTYRKEVRVKAGYVPQDEQPVYQSRGALAKQGVPRVPGMDDHAEAIEPAEIDGAKAAAKSRSAKKNEKRKQKKPEPALDTTTAARKQSDSIADQIEAMNLEERQGNGHAEGDTSFSAADKNARALRKKLKQVDALLEKQKAGTQLTKPEQEKISKAKQWRRELEELEGRVHSEGE